MSVTAPRGFRASGVTAGIKASGATDLALVASARGAVPAAATFTTNRACAAPVTLSRAHLAASGGQAGAIVLNSGCANAATGPSGMRIAEQTCRAVAEGLDLDVAEVLVCSTGLIGIPLPIDRLLGALPESIAELGSSRAHALRAATAILTTDTHAKEVLVECAGARIGGMVKGAGMIAPNMATMLAVLTTDAELTPEQLARSMREAVGESFNELIIDGCTSTNDTVAILASGDAGPVDLAEFTAGLLHACADLAGQLAEDAEGTTKVARITVRGARTADDARAAARGVATSLLVKTSLYGADPYWGRIVSELGASGAAFAMERTSVAYGPTTVFAQGIERAHDRDAVADYLAATEVEITCDLGLGNATHTVTTTDLGHGYIDENMHTS